MGLMRLRAALVGVMSLVLAGMAGRIFDGFEPVLLLAVAVPAVAGLAVLTRSWTTQVVTATVAIIAAVTIVVAVEGGRLPGDVVDAWSDGLRRLMSTEWPSPERPDLLGAVGAVLAVATAVAVALAGRRRWHLVVLLPMIAVFVAIVAASAPAGAAMWWLVALAPLGAAVAALRADREVGETLHILAGDRQLVPLVAVAVGLAAAVSLPLAFDDRADPRTDVTASATEPLVDPVEAVVAMRAIDPPVTLYEITAEDGATALPTRWRVATLDMYDGQRWAPNVVLAPIGRRLGPDRDTELELQIVVRAEGAAAVPLPGPPVIVDADVETDARRTLVRLIEPAEAGTEIDLRTGVEPGRVDVGAGEVVTRPVDEISGAFTNIAELLTGGGGTVVEQLTAIETALAQDFELDVSAPGAGLQQALLQRFLTETRRGTEEQFVVAFVLLARSLGVEARVATGFEVDASRPALTLSTADARVWPEVAFDGGGWVAFDPVPADATTEAPEGQPAPQEQSPAAAPPPIAPLDEDDSTPDEEDEPEAEAGDRSWSTPLVVLAVAGLALGSVLVPLLIVVAVIIGLKRRRRRRRLHAPDPRARIRGAWAVATDVLVDAGLRIAPSSTDHEIVEAGAPLTAGARGELERLGAMSSAVTYATAPTSETVAEDAVAALEQVESTMSSARTRWQRIRWRLSLRSLRRSTRSPVDVHDG